MRQDNLGSQVTPAIAARRVHPVLAELQVSLEQVVSVVTLAIAAQAASRGPVVLVEQPGLLEPVATLATVGFLARVV